MSKKERKPKRWYQPWRWFGGSESGSTLFDLMETGDEGGSEHAAMEAALDLPKDAEIVPEEKPPHIELALAGVPKSHIENQRARVHSPTPGVVVQSAPRSKTALMEPAKTKPALRPPAPRARLQVDARPAPAVSDAWGLDKLSETIAAAASRDEVAREILAYMANHFRRVAIFSVRQDQATGWVGAGPGFFPERVAKTTISLKARSIFAVLASDPNTFVGPIAETVENTDLYAFLGGTIPSAALIVPVTIRDRVVSVLYADNDAEPLAWVDVAVWRRIAEMMAISFEIMILKSKMKG